MENKIKGVKSISNLLSKTLGLVFFSFLAISLGVVFGLLFEGWVKDQPGTPVGTENTLQTSDLQQTDDSTSTVDTTEDIKLSEDTSNNTTVTDQNKTATQVKYKVRVGPYSSRDQAVAASVQLQSLGYPVYVGNNPPFAVQVGAFSAQNNADRVKNDLTSKGYKVFVEQVPQ